MEDLNSVRSKVEKYEDRFVVFVDILGWKSKIKESEENPSLVGELSRCLYSIKEYHKYHEISNQLKISNIQVSQFSDSIFMSAKPDNDFSLIELESFLNQSIWMLVNLLLGQNLLFKGAISFGKVVHNSDIVFGPALNRAYLLHENYKRPRIILDPDLIERLNLSASITGSRIVDGDQKIYKKTFRMDDDNVFFYDFLQPLIPSKAPDLKRVKDMISQSVNHEDEGVKNKYIWLSQYYDSIVEQYNMCDKFD
ncbi:hypothetical protein Lrub_0692 [Legionella rubrilucens]|uniref:Guanylate cyclase domain-containing protein n=1 Tax=Legionella rubrilucens TaxID=458 RepID=A0A0W0XY87_9GAMM|nr:hypothetical protein [Legionella rubrilucens]KTD49593.1 hypothetical protein Lrub_0692 [Legionella rubrilucens]